MWVQIKTIEELHKHLGKKIVLTQGIENPDSVENLLTLKKDGDKFKLYAVGAAPESADAVGTEVGDYEFKKSREAGYNFFLWASDAPAPQELEKSAEVPAADNGQTVGEIGKVEGIDAGEGSPGVPSEASGSDGQTQAGGGSEAGGADAGPTTDAPSEPSAGEVQEAPVTQP